MATRFPGTGIDDSSTLPNPATTDKRNSPSHAGQHANANDAIKAVETKIGTGSSTPVVSTLLFGTGTGTSAWQGLTSAQLAAILSDETGSGSAVFATTPTLVTPKVDTINESTLNNGVTVGGVNLKSGALTTANSVVTSNITDANVTNAKLATGAGQPGGAWTSWTPTFTNLTVGNGVHQSFYTQIGKTVVARVGFAFGSTSSMGTNPSFTLPVAAKSTYTLGTNIGGIALVANSARYTGYAQWKSVSDAFILSLGASSADTTITSSVPNTWGTAGSLYGTITYEAA